MGAGSEFLEGFANSGNVADFIAGAMDEGLSQNAALDLFRESGGSIADYRFGDIWDAVESGDVASGALDTSTWFALPDQDVIETFETKSARGFLYQFNVTEQIFGTDEFTTRVMSVRSDYLISPNQAFRTLSAYYYARPAGQGTPQNLLVGAEDLSVYELMPGGA